MFPYILSIPLAILVFPPVLIILLINELIRYLIKLWLSKLHPTIILSPSGYDSVYAYKNQPHNRRTVLYLAVLKSDQFDISRHRENYEKGLLNREEYSKLRKIWVQKFGYVALKEDLAFDVRRHVRLWENEGVVTEKVLMEEILPKLCRDFGNEDKPQWEDVVVKGFVYGNDPSSTPTHTLRILRMHHGYCDGISNLLMLASTQNNLETFPFVIDPLKEGRISSGKATLLKLTSLLYLPVVALEHLWNGLVKPKSSWIPDSYSGTTVHGWSERIDIRLLQKIKSSTKTSMPAVLVSCLVGALKGSRFSQGEGEEMVLGLVAALLPYSSSLQLTNNHSIVRCGISCSNNSLTRVERLAAINTELTRLSKLPHAYLNHLLPSLYGRFPAGLANLCTGFMTGDGVVSNFPATRERVTLWGEEVEEMAGWVPLLTEAGFGCVTLRYGDSLRYSLNADEAVINKEEMDCLLKGVVKEVHLLEKEVGRGGCGASSRGSLTVGRFLVCPVGEEEEGVEIEKSSIPYSVQQGREERIRRVLDKIIHSFEKVKGV